MRDILEKRKQLATQAFSEADKAKTEAKPRATSTRRRGLSWCRSARPCWLLPTRSIEAERTERLEEARKEATKLIETAHAFIAEERVKTLKGLEADVASLAVKLPEAARQAWRFDFQ